MAGKDNDTESKFAGKDKGKRKRPFGESHRVAYDSISFTRVESNHDPRSPHRFFKESYVVTNAIKNQVVSTEDQHQDQQSPFELSQMVHQHVNGLCVVTAGCQLPDASILAGIDILTKEAPTCSATEKRKRQVKMLKGSDVDDTVSPSTVIAKLKCKSGEAIPIFACVWGTIVEVNHSLTPDILIDDPLLNGYVAIILPTGEFPPKTKLTSTVPGDDNAELQPSKVAKTETPTTDSASPDNTTVN